MTFRRWGVLMLFVAVFAMHGFQCMDASPDATPRSMPAAGSAVDTAEAITAASPQDVTTIAASVAAMTMDAMVAVSPMTSGMDGHTSHPMTSMGHLWSLCLAVLSAGLAVLLALAFTARLGIISPTTVRPMRHWASRGFRPPSPDLSSLCILRI